MVYYVAPHTPLAKVIESCGQSDPNPFKVDLNFECLPPPEAEKFMDDIIDALYDGWYLSTSNVCSPLTYLLHLPHLLQLLNTWIIVGHQD